MDDNEESKTTNVVSIDKYRKSSTESDKFSFIVLNDSILHKMGVIKNGEVAMLFDNDLSGDVGADGIAMSPELALRIGVLLIQLSHVATDINDAQMDDEEHE